MTGSEAPPLLQPLGHSHGETPGDAYVHSANATVSPPVTVPANALVAPVDTLTAAPVAAAATAPIAAPVAASVVAPSAPLTGTPLPNLPNLPGQQYTGKTARRTGTALDARTAPLTPQPAAPQIPTPLSAYEEELLRAYSPTLAGTYERWKGEGEGMPLALSVMMRQWRIRGCPPNHGENKKNDRLEAGVQGTDAKGTTQNYDNATSHPHGHSHDQSPGSPCDSSCDSFADTSNYTDSSDSSHGSSTQYGDAGTLMAAPGHMHPHAQSPAQGVDNTQEAQLGQLAELGQRAQLGQSVQRGNTTAKRIPHSTRSAVAPVANTSPLLRESSPKAAKVEKTGKGDKGEKAAQLTLPGVSVPRTPGDTAPMSNYLARTSLFAPIRKGRRVMHDKQMLHSPEGIDVLYTGKQLDMADQDVYLSALRLAGGIKAGDRIVINRAAFLRMLGYKHNPGARDYKWLEESFYRISTGRVIIKAKHIEANLPLMGALLSDTRSGDYYFTIPRETYALWAKNLYSYIDLEKRHALERNVPLSKWLQSYAQSHAPGVHTISMDLLHLWCGYGGRLRDFRDSLTGALDELTRVGILATWSVQERGKGRQKKVMISWTRERTHRDDTPQPALGEDEGR